MKNYNKVSKYNLADDDEETLTHGGEALTLIQKYDRTRGSDDEEDGEGNIGAQMVGFSTDSMCITWFRSKWLILVVEEIHRGSLVKI